MARTQPQPVDLWRGYIPFPSQAKFHNSRAPWRLLAGGFGGGKTKPASREAIRIAIEYPKSLGLILRRQYRPLIDSTWRTFRRELSETGLDAFCTITGGNSPSSPPYIKLPDELGGSEILFRNAESEENFYGVEPDWVFVDEGSEVADNIYQVLGGRLRGTPNPDGKITNEKGVKVSGPLRVWIATNPGPSNFIRKNFAPPGVPGKPTKGFSTFSVPTLENHTLPDSYLAFLREQYTGARYEAFVKGDWSAFEGQIFTMWDPAQHIIDDVDMGAFRDPERYMVIEGWDFGRQVDTAVVWIVVDNYGREPIVVLGEYGARETDVADHAAAVRGMRHQLGVREVSVIGDPSGAQRGSSGSYIAEYARHGIYIGRCEAGKSPAVRDARLANQLSHRMMNPWDARGPSVPGIVFCRRTQRAQSAVIMAMYDQPRTDDKDPRDQGHVKKDDHFLDALEYAVMVAPRPHKLNARLAPREGLNVSITQALAEERELAEELKAW